MSVVQGAGLVEGYAALGTREADGHRAGLAMLQELAVLHEGRGGCLRAARLHTAHCLLFPRQQIQNVDSRHALPLWSRAAVLEVLGLWQSRHGTGRLNCCPRSGCLFVGVASSLTAGLMPTCLCTWISVQGLSQSTAGHNSRAGSAETCSTSMLQGAIPGTHNENTQVWQQLGDSAALEAAVAARPAPVEQLASCQRDPVLKHLHQKPPCVQALGLHGCMIYTPGLILL